jgi:hypothetical protein
MYIRRGQVHPSMKFTKDIHELGIEQPRDALKNADCIEARVLRLWEWKDSYAYLMLMDEIGQFAALRSCLIGI